MCCNCKHCEAHGYPPEGVEKIAFTVYLWCPLKDAHVNPYDTCELHEEGEPKIVRDDVDGWL